MGVFRGVVLPVARLMVWIVIAIALCVIAFGRDDRSGDTLTPTMNEQQATVPVTRGDIRSVIELTGTVQADPAATVKATATGRVSRMRAEVGDDVANGTPLFDVVVTLPPTVNADGTTKENRRTDIVRSTAVGKLTTLDVLKNQDVAIGATVATVSPGTLTVSAPLTQAQQFRLLTPPPEAQVQADGGPAPFTCTGLATGAKPADTNNNNQQNPSFDPYSGQPSNPETTTAQVSCRVPVGTTVFAGMSVHLTIDNGSVTGVLTVPTSAVQGSVGSGYVWVPGPNGTPQRQSVTLGLTDGTRVEVTGGLTDDAQVLEFAPVTDAASGQDTQPTDAQPTDTQPTDAPAADAGG